jgi:peptide/nickel transport system permease protein
MVFLLARVVPGDPARMALGPRAPEYALENMRTQMNLDKPLYQQYVLWLGGVLQGDMGMSLISRRPVQEDIRDYFPATLELVLLAGVFMTIGGILLGILSARYANSWFDSLVRLLAYMGIVTPAFVWAILLILVFGYAIPIFPFQGRISPELVSPPTITGLLTLDSLMTGNFGAFWDALKHLVLPAIACAMGGLAQAARITRSSMIDNMGKDYVLAESASGIPQRVIFLKYLLRPSLIPTISILALDIAALFGMAFVVELVFNFPGLSRYGMNAILQKDLNTISGVLMVFGSIFVGVTILIDLIVAFLDPRIRLSQRGG